jgi:hypothetical protein
VNSVVYPCLHQNAWNFLTLSESVSFYLRNRPQSNQHSFFFHFKLFNDHKFHFDPITASV